MSLLTYARVDGGVVQEPLVQLPSGVLPAQVFAGSQTWVDVTSVNPPPAVGETVTQNGGATTFTPANAPQVPGLGPVPAAVSRYQFKMVLAGMAGSGSTKLLDNVNTWIGTQPDTTQVAWSDAAAISRGGAFVAALAAQFGWASAAVDGYFRAAIQVLPTV